MNLVLHFDGGCHPNPGHGYGSWEVVDKHGTVIATKRRFRLGTARVTNNEAEWLTLLDGLQAIQKLYPAKLEIWSDSVLVVQQLRGRWKCRKDHLAVLRDKCLEILNTGMLICLWEISWNRRDANMVRFGH